MAMSQELENIEIIRVRGHYEGYINGEFITSGDTQNEVYSELKEMGYLK